ncbi:UDP-glucuronic acid decarboxylase family protein [Thioclava sp. F36-6]|uniref:UDP-glucuronic acid decarboxylase family protein n=1 Tax=Thioclava sp. F36-6 TaxID=1915316 RepID=UPI00099860E2|nr:UDP-glucuronic acid decarboxylase family protein [Thioclava sp. F36-6]
MTHLPRFETQDISWAPPRRHKGQLRCLVAGGAGFLGSHLCDRLIEAGHSVICIDNLLTGRTKNIAHLMGHPDFTFLRHDVIAPLQMHGEIDRIYNLACAASPPKYQLDPLHTFQTCVAGSMNLLSLAERTGARILQASTSEVYGDPDISPQREDYRGRVNTTGPRACYDEGKRAAETLFHDLQACRGIDTRIARIFNTYGPRMDPEDGRVISNFVTRAIRGTPLELYGGGTQTRSLCYVDDLISGLVALMESETVGHEPVNLGNPGEYTVAELAHIVRDMCESRAPLVVSDLPLDDPMQRCPDITRAETRLGWRPEIALRSGLVPTIAYFRAEIAGVETATAPITATAAE